MTPVMIAFADLSSPCLVSLTVVLLSPPYDRWLQDMEERDQPGIFAYFFAGKKNPSSAWQMKLNVQETLSLSKFGSRKDLLCLKYPCFSEGHSMIDVKETPQEFKVQGIS